MADFDPPSTLADFTVPAATTPTWHHRAKETYTPTSSYTLPSTISSSLPSSSNHDSPNFWDKFGNGAKVAVILSAMLGVLIVVVLSMWFCCNCCGLRRKRRRPHEQDRAERNANGVLPMHALQNRTVVEPPPMARLGTRPVSDAPPSYEEAVPAQHQRLAGGLSNTTSEEDDAVISDGKTPLSEMPFEDVVLDHVSSQSSGSRTFDQMHHGAGGDTRGHTNS
ncbi:hypothetical protein LSUE1_G004597 [Lachnellula suecica]|uniref:Uncharacterized protein n=1 Tax=Lachnellula suecica TaxID=602035 RepID=A0A8T9C5K4_9HELO|nr:hypothetical protein LSUE1_G004597 [Lachnellula suecica]